MAGCRSGDRQANPFAQRAVLRTRLLTLYELNSSDREIQLLRIPSRCIAPSKSNTLSLRRSRDVREVVPSRSCDSELEYQLVGHPKWTAFANACCIIRGDCSAFHNPRLYNVVVLWWHHSSSTPNSLLRASKGARSLVVLACSHEPLRSWSARKGTCV